MQFTFLKVCRNTKSQKYYWKLLFWEFKVIQGHWH